MAITAANRALEVDIILDQHSQAERGMVSSRQNSAAQRSKTPCDRPVQTEVLRLMFRLFCERDGKSGPIGVKAVTICPLCHTRAMVPIFVLEWRKFGAPEKIKMRTFRVGLFGCKTH